MSDFEPYNNEWKEQIMKLPKDQIVEMFSNVGKKKDKILEVSVQMLKWISKQNDWIGEDPKYEWKEVIESATK